MACEKSINWNVCPCGNTTRRRTGKLCGSCSQREYKKRAPEKFTRRNRLYYLKNYNLIRIQQNTDYYREHEKSLARHKKYRTENREKRNAYFKERRGAAKVGVD